MVANANAYTGTPKSSPRIVEAQDSVTRPANTTQYADGDAISDNATTPTAAGYFMLTLATVPGGAVLLTDFTLHKSDQDQAAADITLLLFDEVPALAGFEDNGAMAITDAEFKTCKGVIPFDADDWSNVGGGDIQTVSKTIAIIPTSALTAIYGIMVANGTYTPGSAEVFTLTAKGYQE